jgi:hypothetical protein
MLTASHGSVRRPDGFQAPVTDACLDVRAPKEEGRVSIEVIEWVLDYTQARGATWRVAVALANYAKKDGSEARPSHSTLADKAKVGRGHVAEHLAALVKLGEIERTGTHQSGAVVYRFTMRKGSPAVGLPHDGVTPPRDQSRSGIPPTPPRDSAYPATGHDPSRTVHEPSPSLGEVAPLNGHTVEVVERFKLVQRDHPNLRPIDVPRLLRVLNDFSHLPDLRIEALAAAEWLAGSEAKARAKRDAIKFLSGWLRRHVPKAQPTGHLAESRSNWQDFAARQKAAQGR